MTLRHLICFLTGGHDRLPKFKDNRITLVCTSCGSETPGWDLNEVPPTVTAKRIASRPGIA